MTINDNYRKYALQFEFVRCLLFFAIEQQLSPLTEPMLSIGSYRYALIQTLRITFLLSAIMCAAFEFHKISANILDKRKFNTIKKLRTE